MIIPKVIAVDLDGTLLRSDSTLSARSGHALTRAAAAGTRIVVATGRPPRVVDAILGGSGLTGTAVCCNGALRYDLGSDDITVVHPLAASVAQNLIEQLTKHLPGAGFAVETGRRVLFEPGYRYTPTVDRDRVVVPSITELLAEPVVKLMVWLPEQNPEAVWSRLAPEFADGLECTWSGKRAPLEITAVGLSKASGLAELCAGWQVMSAEVIAFGDGPNDLPMLRWAGTAYAMANAHPWVLAAVSSHTAGNDEDGVAQVLEQLYAHS